VRFDFAKLAQTERGAAHGGTAAITAKITTEEPMPAETPANALALPAAKAAKPIPLARVPSAQLSTEDKAQRVEIIKRAQNGDRAVLPQVRALLKDAPAGGLMPVAENTQDSLLKAMYADNLLALEDTRHQMTVLRRDLAGANPTPLETLLVERIGFCWLTLHYHESIYAQIMGKLPGDAHKRFQDRIDRAQRRYLSSIKALAQVRRLQIPLSVQVNVAAQGGQQVNVSGGTSGG